MPVPTPDVTITGTTHSIFGSSPTGKEAIVVTLVNYGRNLPTVNGTLFLLDLVQTITPAADGSISQALFSNAVIAPGPNTTYYVFDFVNGAGEVALTVPYQFTAPGTFDLSALVPFSGPFPMPPFGNAVLTNPSAAQTIALFELNVPSLGVKGPSTFYTNVTSNATATRAFTLPDAASNPVRPATAPAHQFVIAVAADGTLSFAQPAFADISGTATSGQYVTMVGDSGSGGVKGAAPAPGAGDTAAGKFLKADGTWSVPAGSGGSSYTTVSKTANYTASNGDDVWCNGTFTVTLPTASTTTRVKISNQGTGAITVTPASGTIIGNSSMVLGTQFSSVELSSNGTNWTVE
jgi:hypothetical protein